MLAQRREGLGCETLEAGCERRSEPRIERRLDAGLAQHANICDADAICRQHAGKRMDDDAPDAERFRDLRRMLTAGAAETAQREASDVMTALHRDLLDRVRHALDGHAKEPRGDLLEPRRIAGRADVAR